MLNMHTLHILQFSDICATIVTAHILEQYAKCIMHVMQYLLATSLKLLYQNLIVKHLFNAYVTAKITEIYKYRCQHMCGIYS